MNEVHGVSPGGEIPADLNSAGVDAAIDRQALGRTFPVGWSTVSEDLTKGRSDGHVIFLIVDDYTDYCLWDRYLYDIAPKMGVRPDFRKEDGSPSDEMGEQLKNLPSGNFMAYDIMHSMASDSLYTKGGITKPTFEQLPAIFALKIGEPEGRYVLNAKEELAAKFMQNVLDDWKP